MPVSLDDIPPAGTRVSIELNDIFGKPYTMEGTIEAEAVQDGFHRNGSWAKYGRTGGGDGWLPCFKLGVRQRGKRKLGAVRLDQMNSIKEGWDYS